MENIAAITALVAEIGVLLGAVAPVIASNRKITNGQRSLLRNEMLQIYYRSKENGVIHQYEYENFVSLYEAYKSLKGNSFIDKIYKELQEFEVIK